MPSIKQWLAQPLTKRLLPLYVAAFSHGLVLWYAVEKPFMSSIGFNEATIGVMVACYAGLMPFIETPSGILADRWSRKGVLIVASISLIASSLVGGLSNSIPMYIVCACLWGIFFGMYSGTYDSIMYDTVLEQTGTTNDFEKRFGHIKALDSLALIIGSLTGGVLAAAFTMQLVYFLTIPCVFISIFALWRFKEPTLHKSEVAVPLVKHIRSTFKAVLRRGFVMQVVLTLLLLSLILQTVLEFNQLWLLALAAPLVIFGPANAAALGALGVGGTLAYRFGLHRRVALLSAMVVLVCSSILLATVKNAVIVIMCQATMVLVVTALSVIFTKQLHDNLPSHVRAGAASAVSTFSWIVFVPLALLFGLISQNQSAFEASWIVVSVAVLTSLLLLKTTFGAALHPAETKDSLAVETYDK